MREWLIAIRKEKRLSRKSVAANCFISESYYEKIEYGLRNVPVSTAKAIAKALSFDWQRFYQDDLVKGGEEDG